MWIPLCEADFSKGKDCIQTFSFGHLVQTESYYS